MIHSFYYLSQVALRQWRRVGYPSQRTSTTEGGNCNCRLIYMLKTEIYLIYVTPHPTIHISHHDYQEYVDGPLVAADLLF